MQRRYVAPADQSGIRLRSVVGCNGNGRQNVIWDADLGFFAYTVGCLVVVEDLKTSEQCHLAGHNEEISTMALQHDCTVPHLPRRSNRSGSTGRRLGPLVFLPFSAHGLGERLEGTSAVAAHRLGRSEPDGAEGDQPARLRHRLPGVLARRPLPAQHRLDVVARFGRVSKLAERRRRAHQATTRT